MGLCLPRGDPLTISGLPGPRVFLWLGLCTCPLLPQGVKGPLLCWGVGNHSCLWSRGASEEYVSLWACSILRQGHCLLERVSVVFLCCGSVISVFGSRVFGKVVKVQGSHWWGSAQLLTCSLSVSRSWSQRAEGGNSPGECSF